MTKFRTVRPPHDKVQRSNA